MSDTSGIVTWRSSSFFSADLPTTTTAEAVFNTVDMYLGSVGLAWDGCVGVTTDRAAAVTGKHSEVVKRILDRAPSATWNHCFLHREALAAKDMVPELHTTLQDVIKRVNYIKKKLHVKQVFPGLLRGYEERAPAGALSCRGPLALQG